MTGTSAVRGSALRSARSELPGSEGEAEVEKNRARLELAHELRGAKRGVGRTYLEVRGSEDLCDELNDHRVVVDDQDAFVRHCFLTSGHETGPAPVG